MMNDDWRLSIIEIIIPLSLVYIDNNYNNLSSHHQPQPQWMVKYLEKIQKFEDNKEAQEAEYYEHLKTLQIETPAIVMEELRATDDLCHGRGSVERSHS